MFISLNELESLVLDVSNRHLDATFVHPEGKGFSTPDHFTILKK